MRIRCITIDDEPLAVRKMAAYIQKVPFLELVAECRSAFEAIAVLNENSVQLIFVDINMPELSGMDFVKAIPDKPYIVFTTAYSEYAVEGFQVDAVDYLLKPITFSNFLKAVNKVKSRIELSAPGQRETVKSTDKHLFVKSEYKLIRVELDDIQYIESQHEYIKIHMFNSTPVITRQSLKNFEELLPDTQFMKVHRSFIVNLRKISVIENNRIVFNDKVYIPISDQYKDRFQEYIDGNFG
jgi:DNA-binding LytR/AlgR family response regulator